MDEEISAAAEAGLKYWAFDWYRSESSFRKAWNLYQSSGKKYLINWCGIVGLDALGSVPFSKDAWRANIDQWAEYMLQPTYQKVRGGESERARPLLYILWNKDQFHWYFGSSFGNLRLALRRLGDACQAAHLGDPYIVILTGSDGAPLVRDSGADAIGSYISSLKKVPAGSFRELDMQTRAYWKELARAGLPMVPTAIIGWDTRPRQERPVPWDHGRQSNPNPTEYFSMATPGEFAAHLQAAANFIQDHPAICPTRTLLIYSWDECDEGGCMMPTLGDATGRYLQAIAPIIR